MAEKLKPGLREKLGRGQEFNAILKEDSYILKIRVETHGAKFGVPEFDALKVPMGTQIRHMNVKLWKLVDDTNIRIFNKHTILEIK